MMKHTINATTIRDLNYSKATPPVSIPTGTKVELFFKPDNDTRAFITHNGVDRPVAISLLHKTLKSAVKFNQMPSLARLEKMSYDGVCTTVTGGRTEPDGHDEYGAPSWLLVAGVI